MTDHTAAICKLLNTEQPTRLDGDEFEYPISLLSGTLEADGLAVRLVREYHKMRATADRSLDTEDFWLLEIEILTHGYFCFPFASKEHREPYDSFAAAVHDALVEALGIGEDTP